MQADIHFLSLLILGKKKKEMPTLRAYSKYSIFKLGQGKDDVSLVKMKGPQRLSVICFLKINNHNSVFYLC